LGVGNSTLVFKNSTLVIRNSTLVFTESTLVIINSTLVFRNSTLVSEIQHCSILQGHFGAAAEAALDPYEAALPEEKAAKQVYLLILKYTW